MGKAVSSDGTDAKIVVYSRIAPGSVAALDQICNSMKPKPTRAQLIDLAVSEYVERHHKFTTTRRTKVGK